MVVGFPEEYDIELPDDVIQAQLAAILDEMYRTHVVRSDGAYQGTIEDWVALLLSDSLMLATEDMDDMHFDEGGVGGLTDEAYAFAFLDITRHLYRQLRVRLPVLNKRLVALFTHDWVSQTLKSIFD